MGETYHSTGGLRRISRLGSVVNVRLVVFALAVGLGVLLILWLQASVGRQMAHLEAEFAALQAEAFYVGVQTRVRVRRLNDLVLGFRLDRDPADLADFRKEAAELQRWFANKELNLSTVEERTLFDQTEAAYDRYLVNVERLIQTADTGAERVTFAATYEALEEQSGPLFGVIGQLMEIQQATFNAFLQASQDTLVSLRRLLQLSLGLLVAAGAALTGLLYRGVFAPLRRRLTDTEATLARQEKLASLGTLAAGVAHEIRNPLTAIKFRLFSLRQALPTEFADHEDAAVISSEIDRLDGIVKQFLRFARPAEPELARVPARQLLLDVCDLLGPGLDKSNIALQLGPSISSWVFADIQQIKQVLINLVQNAAESIQRDGRITLAARFGHFTQSGRPVPAVILSVTDTGPGISAAVADRLFDPFFTTKENGTGLGLAISARIVEKHGGLLRYRTELKHGTTFEVALPSSEDHACQPPDH